MRMLAATNNQHKLEELRAILAPRGITVLGLREAGICLEVEEDGDTFVANAVKKALAGAAVSQMPVLADDSGLEVAALGGLPGVRSARYAGEGAGDAANLRKLMVAMDGVVERRARFVCVIAVALPDGQLRGTADGEVRGRIAAAATGGGGFGYDPVFVPDGFDVSFAALPAEVKNRLSHRANALQAAVLAGLL